MKAFHTLRVRSEKVSLQDFELLTMLISALEWRKHNGSIKLVTDRRGEKYIRQLGIADAWDELEVSLDEIDQLGIDENVFWAGAKLFALSRQTAPCVMIDLDFIVWRPIDFEIYKDNIAAIHREHIDGSIYPPKKFFRFVDGWRFPDWLDWTVEPRNSAFAYFGSDGFIERYTQFAFTFMEKTDLRQTGLPHMVFAEQRWLAMCAQRYNKTICEFSSLPELLSDRQEYFTHLWGYKETLRKDRALEKNFCRDCIARLKYDFPDFAYKF